MAEYTIMYVRPFLTALCISVIACAALIGVARQMRHKDRRRGARHQHGMGISRFGGIAMIVAFCVTLALDPLLVFDRTVWVFVVGACAILVFGVADDVYPLSWRTQFFVQIALVLVTFIFGVRIAFVAHPFGGILPLVMGSIALGSLLFMLVWMPVIMNAINWADGIDGVAGGIAVIAAVTIFVLALRPNVLQPPIAIIAIVFAGAVMGFLLFNLPPARILAGTSGAFFMGYVLAVMAIVAGAKVGTTLMVLAVPLMDAAWVTIARVRRHASIFHGDVGHMHHRLLRRGWRVWHVVLFYYAVTAACAMVALTTVSQYKWGVFLLIGLGITTFFLLYTRDSRSRIALS